MSAVIDLSLLGEGGEQGPMAVVAGWSEMGFDHGKTGN